MVWLCFMSTSKYSTQSPPISKYFKENCGLNVEQGGPPCSKGLEEILLIRMCCVMGNITHNAAVLALAPQD